MFLFFSRCVNPIEFTANSYQRVNGANDLWIASHALADDCTLVTNKLREFKRVAGLKLENWAQDAVPPSPV